ncbi:hypothetical protein ISS03_01805 [Patescibacteria group bacterium]|nr:hypothetical protein [Patescibacteria group bacterium]
MTILDSLPLASQEKKPVAQNTTEQQPTKPEAKEREYTEEEKKKIERLERDENVLNIMNKLDSSIELELQERIDAAAMINNINNANIYNNLNTGDKVATFMVPSGGILSIKNMNDNIFGMQKTNAVIGKRRALMATLLEKANIQLLEQDFKTATCKVDTGSVDKKGIKTKKSAEEERVVMETICQKVNVEMSEYLLGMINQELELEDPKSEKIKMLEAFKEAITREGFRVTYGITEIGTANDPTDEEDMSHIELSLAITTQTALMARREKEQYGKVFNEEDIKSELKEIGELRNEIISKLGGNRFNIGDDKSSVQEKLQKKLEGAQLLYDQNGVGHKIFTVTEDGLLEMNTDVMRAVRKDKFKLRDKDKESFGPVLNDIAQYIRRVNVFDIMKPFTHNEISGDKKIRDSEMSFRGRMQEQKTIADKILNKEELTQGEAKRAVELLGRAPKNEFCTSEAIFNAESLKINKCTDISLDRLDLGVDLLKEFEKLQQEVVNETKGLEDASTIAGDKVTASMRDMREVAFKEFKQLLPKEAFLTLVGGDELTIAINNDNVTEKEIETLLFNLQEKTNSRIVKTIITDTMRDSTGHSAEQRKLDHLEAIKRAEKGAEIAKVIEENKRLLGFKLERTDFFREVNAMENHGFKEEVFSALDLSSFVVEEDEGKKFTVKSKNSQGSIRERGIEKILELLSRATEYIVNADNIGMSSEKLLETIVHMRN